MLYTLYHIIRFILKLSFSLLNKIFVLRKNSKSSCKRVCNFTNWIKCAFYCMFKKTSSSFDDSFPTTYRATNKALSRFVKKISKACS